MSVEWHPAEYSLRFQFGDQPFLSKRLKLYAKQLSLPMLLSREEWRIPPVQELPQKTAGYLVRSVPSQDPEATITKVDGYLRYVIERGPRFYVELTGTFDEYLQRHLSSKTRSTLQRKIRKFSQFSGGAIDWKSYRNPAELEIFHALALTVSDQTYQARLFNSGLPRGAEFIAEMHNLARSDDVRAYILFSRGTPAAYLYLPNRAGTLIYAYLGYSPTFRDWSVGTILHWFALKDLFGESRFHYLDFTEGEGEHKKLFATGNVISESILFLRDSLANNALLRAHLHTNGLSTTIGRILGRLGIKSVVRRVIRNGLRGPWRKAS